MQRVAAAREAMRRELGPGPSRCGAIPSGRILVATDGSPEAERAAHLAGELSADHAARILLMSVADTRWANTTGDVEICIDAVYEGLRDQASHVLDEAAARVPVGVRAERAVRVGTPGSEIVDAAREWGADLIAMGSRGRGRLGALLLGSTVQQVLHEATCPVLVVGHAAAAARTGRADGAPGAAQPRAPLAATHERTSDGLREETES